jgi:DNA-binding XRE family transcriptional regulator
MPNNTNEKDRITAEFVELLPMLRVRLGITQKELGYKVGATRHTIMFVETKRNALTWSMFLSLVFFFLLEPRTRPFLLASGIIGDDLSRILFGDDSMQAHIASLLDSQKPMLAKAKEMLDNLSNAIDE